MGIAANALGISGPLLPTLPRPDQRQKVERPIGYLQDSCFYARRFANDADLNEQAQRWLEQTANVRRHDTTGERPLERFERDARGALQPLAERPYRRIARHTTGRHDSAQALARVRCGGTPPATRLCGGCSMRAPSDDRRERLRAMLADLKMPGVLEAVDGILAEADSGAVNAAEAIENPLASHIVLRNNRRLETAMRSSRLPAGQDLGPVRLRLPAEHQA